MNTLTQPDLAHIYGGQIPPGVGDQNQIEQWVFDQFLLQLQQQAEAAQRKEWLEFMRSQAA